MSFTRVQRGESPAMVARRLNTSVGALMFANRHKPTTVVSGKHTWQGVGVGELLHIPRPGVGIGDSGMLGAITPAAPGAPHAMIRQGSSGPDVALWQTIIGATADGIFGPKTAAATKSWQGTHGLAADGIVGPKTWAAAVGAGAPVTVATPAATPPPMTSPPSSLSSAANAALAALRADANYCTNVAKTGTAVNTAVHNFKSAWNNANPGRAVPIGTGKYEVVVAAALWSALGGASDVPPGCGAAGVPVAAAPAPVASTPAAMPAAPPPPPSMPAPSAPSAPNVPSAVQALTSINPCDQGYAALVSQAQSALGVTVDGKYGSATAAAARRLVPDAPAGCSPRPAWWTPPGSTNTPAGAVPSAPAAPPASSAPASAPAVQAPIQQATPAGSPAATVIVPEAKKGLSTGAIVAGAVGAAALVGLLAAAAMGGKKTSTSRTTISRGPARRKPSKRKSAHKSKRKSKSRRR